MARPVADIQTHGLIGEQKFTESEIRIYLRCFDQSMKFSWIKAPWYPGASPKDSQLVIICPWCEQQIRIAGYNKTLKHEPLSMAIPIELPGDETGERIMVEQTHNVSIDENCGCAKCRKMFRITDNAIYGV